LSAAGGRRRPDLPRGSRRAGRSPRRGGNAQDADLAAVISQSAGWLTGSRSTPKTMPWCTGIGAVGAQPWLARLKDWETVGDKVTVKQTRIEQRSGGALAQGTTGLDGGGRLAGRLRVTTTPANFERLAQSLLGEDRRAKAVQALARAGRTDPQVEAGRRR